MQLLFRWFEALKVPDGSHSFVILVLPHFSIAACFALLEILHSMPGGSRELLVDVSESGFLFHPILLTIYSLFCRYFISVLFLALLELGFLSRGFGGSSEVLVYVSELNSYFYQFLRRIMNKLLTQFFWFNSPRNLTENFVGQKNSYFFPYTFQNIVQCAFFVTKFFWPFLKRVEVCRYFSMTGSCYPFFNISYPYHL